MGSPHGLQSTWAHHDGLQNAKIVHMGRNVPKRWAQGDLSGEPDRHGPARGDARRFVRPQTGTPTRTAVPRRQDFSSDRPGDISAFLCNILEANNVKPKRVLKAQNLPTHDLQDGHALNALFQAALPYMPETVASDTDASGTDHSLIDSQASDASDD